MKVKHGLLIGMDGVFYRGQAYENTIFFVVIAGSINFKYKLACSRRLFIILFYLFLVFFNHSTVVFLCLIRKA